MRVGGSRKGFVGFAVEKNPEAEAKGSFTALGYNRPRGETAKTVSWQRKVNPGGEKAQESYVLHLV
jgi:hypothetical protein